MAYLTTRKQTQKVTTTYLKHRDYKSQTMQTALGGRSELECQLAPHDESLKDC